MKTLFVLRHAKAVTDHTLDDIDRPLAERGLSDMARMAEHIADVGVRPDVVYCSPAVRTRQTLEVITTAMGSPKVVFDDLLYGASSGELIDLTRRLPSDAGTAMLIGHNPGFADFVGALTQSYVEFPTGALAVLDLRVNDWSAVTVGELRDVVVPKQLR